MWKQQHLTGAAVCRRVHISDHKFYPSFCRGVDKRVSLCFSLLSPPLSPFYPLLAVSSSLSHPFLAPPWTPCVVGGRADVRTIESAGVRRWITAARGCSLR